MNLDRLEGFAARRPRLLWHGCEDQPERL